MNKHNKINEHWNTYTPLCRPCVIPYNKIIKLESQDEDSYDVIRKKLSGRGLRTKGNVVSGGAKSRMVEGRLIPEYANISSSQLDALLSIYGRDMDMFGYKWERLHNGDIVTKCSMDTDKGDVCC